MFRRSLRIIVGLGIASAAPTVLAQHGEGQEHGKPAEFKMPTTYIDAVKEIEHRLHEIEELMESQHLDDVHAQADVIKRVGEKIGQLALKADSGVPKDAVKEINQAGKALAGKFDTIDQAADSGDAAATQKVYDEMVKLSETLGQFVPKVFACPMKCEGDKTYNKAGKCPKCGMNLEEVKPHSDHQAKHGGSFFMAPDKKHHLEGTLSEQGEVRIYFYDEYTKPIDAKTFTAEGKSWVSGADESKAAPIAFKLEPGGAFLTASIAPITKLPVRIKTFIDFKDGQKPQVFDFEFAEPSHDEQRAHESDDDHAPPVSHDGHGGGSRK